MSFEVVVAGRLADGADPAQVRANLAKLFKTDVARVEHLLSGDRVVIKKGLDEAAAGKYRAVIVKAGLIAEIVDSSAGTAASAGAAPAAEPEAAAAGAGSAALASPTPPAETRAPAAVAAADASGPPAPLDASMAEPGALLVEPQAVAAPDINTDHLDLAEVGVTLVEPVEVPEPQYDLSGMQLDPIDEG